MAGQLPPVIRKRNSFDLRAADVDADSHAATIAYSQAVVVCRAALLRVSFGVAAGSAGAARAQTCMTLRYTFQPDCYRAAGGAACAQTVKRLDLGPQIAVWLESADGTRSSTP